MTTQDAGTGMPAVSTAAQIDQHRLLILHVVSAGSGELDHDLAAERSCSR